MQQPTSPLFDIPEIPTMRRVIPLPKRKILNSTISPEGIGRTHADIPSPPKKRIPFSELHQDATTEELLAHASDSLSQLQFTDPANYLPILGSVHKLLQTTLASATSEHVAKALGVGGWSTGRDDEEGEENDRDGFLRQPNNTKKRKVPLNALLSQPIDDGQRDSLVSYAGRAVPASSTSLASRSTSRIMSAQPRAAPFSKATMAGLKHKEVLKQRKRQLAAVLGAITHGDTSALDQALSVTFPSLLDITGDMKRPVSIRLSQRRGPRQARLAKLLSRMALSASPASTVTAPSSEFSFRCHSTTSDRLIATKAEVASLRTRFEAELARQARRLAKTSGQNKLAQTRQGKSKAPRMLNSTSPTDPLLQSLGLTKGANQNGKNKKKKRSALAIASNPHHRRNYVPGRLLGSGAASAKPVDRDAFGAIPLRFLAADLPPLRRASRQSRDRDRDRERLTTPSEEWICPWCEYELFYGSEREYRKAVNNRKKILRRRRRAERRAANVTSKVGDKSREEQDGTDEDDDDYEYPGYSNRLDFGSASAAHPGNCERDDVNSAVYG